MAAVNIVLASKVTVRPYCMGFLKTIEDNNIYEEVGRKDLYVNKMELKSPLLIVAIHSIGQCYPENDDAADG